MSAFRLGVWVVAVLACGAIRAQSAAEAPAADPVIELLQSRAAHFLDEVAAGNVQVAYEQLLADSPLLKQTEAIRQVVEKIQALKNTAGAWRGYEAVGAKRIGTDVVLLRYVVKCDDFPVIWTFVFYRPPAAAPPAESVWRVVSVRFDTQLELLGF